ncbi:MAG: DUF4391 domain-containing protein [Paracoccaceae bacterium]
MAILQVMLTAADRHTRIASVIQKAIPYPLLIVFVCGSRLAVSAADKRIMRGGNVRRDILTVEEAPRASGRHSLSAYRR